MSDGIGFQVSLDPSMLQKGLATANSAVHGFQNSVQSSFGAIMKVTSLLGVSFAAFRSAEGIVGSLKDVFAAGKELQHAALTTGQTISGILTAQKAFSLVGNEAGSVEENIAKMEEALGGVSEMGADTGTVFRRLNLSIADLKAAPAVDAMEAITGAIAKLPTAADKLNATKAIFGRGGMGMLALTPAAFEEARAQLGGYATMMERNAGLFARITNDLEALSGKVRKFFAGVADQIGPALLPLLEQIKGIDLMASGEHLGGVLKGWLNDLRSGIELVTAAWKDGSTSEMVGLSLNVGFNDAVATLFKNLKAGFEEMKAPMAKIFEGVDAIFYGLSIKMGDAIELGINNALRGAKVLGVPIVSEASFQEQQKEAGWRGIVSDKYITGGLKKLTEGVGLQNAHLGGFLGAVTEEKSVAKRDLKALRERLAIANFTTVDQANMPVGGPSNIGAPALQAFTKKDVLSDRLAKIGLFIGGAGGPPGQKAQEDTARNTATMVQQQKEMISKLNEKHRATF